MLFELAVCICIYDTDVCTCIYIYICIYPRVYGYTHHRILYSNASREAYTVMYVCMYVYNA